MGGIPHDADARLIAAAPELLAALKAVHGTKCGAGDGQCIACEAIAKAEGKVKV